jgi:GntR family transcriptional regulator / MocR family aminotransferase
MAKESAAFDLASLRTDRASSTPLHAQLYIQLREAITGGRLRAGTRLPSTRALSTELGLSRNTVQNAFEQLLDEGYLEGRVGSGTYVAAHLPEEMVAQRDFPRANGTRQKLHTHDFTLPELSHRASVLSAARWPMSLPVDRPRAFRLNIPALDAFPFDIWARLISQHLQQPTDYLLGYGEPAGYGPLREAISDYLGTTRAVKCCPDQVIIVSGSQQAFDLVAQVLIDPGDAVWVEDPGYIVARQPWVNAGAKIVPVPIDEQGLSVEAGESMNSKPRMVYVVPSHQFPTGATMPLSRRMQLLEMAGRSGAWILEDDYNSEYCYNGPPPAALQGLDEQGRVVYTGTFRRVMFPGLHLGYVVAPTSLVEAFHAARRLLDGPGTVFEQAVLADFISEGHFARHLRRMRKLYAARQETLIQIARRELAGMLSIEATASGMHLVGWLPQGVDDRKVAKSAAAHQVEVQPLSPQSVGPVKRNGILLGFAGFDEQEIERGVCRLAAALRAAMQSQPHAPTKPAEVSPLKPPCWDYLRGA